MSWEPESSGPPATTPAAPPPAFDQLALAAQNAAAGDALERDQLENKIEAVDDQTQREVGGWALDLAKWGVGGLIIGGAFVAFTRRKR